MVNKGIFFSWSKWVNKENTGGMQRQYKRSTEEKLGKYRVNARGKQGKCRYYKMKYRGNAKKYRINVGEIHK